MRFATTLFTMIFLGFYATFISAAAIGMAESAAIVAREAEAAGTDVVVTTLPDGRQKIDFLVNGVVGASLVEGLGDNDVELLDEHGNPISVPDEDDSVLEKRQLGAALRIAAKYKNLILKFGKRVVTYFVCVGINVVASCNDIVLHCATIGQAPWDCLLATRCFGKATKGC